MEGWIDAEELLDENSEYNKLQKQEWIEKNKKYKKHGIRIGNVEVDVKTGQLVLKPYSNKYSEYRIEISELETQYGILVWINHLVEKGWCTPELLGQCIFAAKEYWEYIKFGNEQCRDIPLDHVWQLY